MHTMMPLLNDGAAPDHEFTTRYRILCEYTAQLLTDMGRLRAKFCPRWLVEAGKQPKFVFRPTGDEVFTPEDGRIVVNDMQVTANAMRHINLEAARAYTAFYYLHELRHHLQGLMHKFNVKWLVDVGAHDALAEIDLAADHGAAEDLVGLEWGWSLLHVKEMQSRALLNFPAVAGTHSAAACHRKAMRLASVRSDYLVRRRGPLARRTWNGFIAVRYGGSAPGSFVMLQVTETLQVVGRAELLNGELDLLQRAAMRDELRNIDELDSVLERCLANLVYTEDFRLVA